MKICKSYLAKKLPDIQGEHPLPQKHIVRRGSCMLEKPCCLAGHCSSHTHHIGEKEMALVPLVQKDHHQQKEHDSSTGG